MRFYKPHTKFYCGIDVHSRIIYMCIIGEDKKALVHRKLKNQDTGKLVKILLKYKDDIVIACESTFAWYWLSDFCAEHGFEFILGHPYYMKAISGAKVKNDKVDSEKIARLVQAGMFPLAYACCRLVRCSHESAGKRYGSGSKKMGNVYLKRAFSEAAIFVTKFNPRIEKYQKKLESRKGKMKAYRCLAQGIISDAVSEIKSESVILFTAKMLQVI